MRPYCKASYAFRLFTSSSILYKMDFKKPETVLALENIRSALVRMEDTILFDLIERAQFYSSPAIYDNKQLSIPGSNMSLLDFLLLESERIHSKIETPFTSCLPLTDLQAWSEDIRLQMKFLFFLITCRILSFLLIITPRF